MSVKPDAVPARHTPGLEGEVVRAWPEGLTIEDYLEELAAAGVIELLDDDDVTWCERCGAATDRGACGCLRSVKRVG